MKKSTVIIGAAIVLVLGAAIARRLNQDTQFADAVSPPVMDAEYPVTGDIRLTANLIGEIEPSNIVYVYPKASGDIMQVYVKAGDIVSSGQVICTVNTRQVESAKNTYDSAQLALKQARDDLSRQQILYASGGISDQVYEQYKDAVTSAEIAFAQAEYDYKTQQEYSEITAPIDGLVELVDMEPYDNVSQSNLICVISERGTRTVSFSATERISEYLDVGDTIEVERDGNIYEGVIYEVSTMADETTGLYKVKASVDVETHLPTGSEAKLHVIKEKTEGAMTIPVDAVYYENGEPYVYVYEDGRVYTRDVETGIYDSETMEILGGLDYSDLVVTTWSSELYEGAEVLLSDAQVQEGQSDTAGEE